MGSSFWGDTSRRNELLKDLEDKCLEAEIWDARLQLEDGTMRHLNVTNAVVFAKAVSILIFLKVVRKNVK